MHLTWPEPCRILDQPDSVADFCTCHFKKCSSIVYCIAGPREKRWEWQLQHTLAQLIHTGKHPRTCIQIVVQVIHDDGSLLSAALNAATAALLDACIPMHSMFCAATVAVASDGSQLLDPDRSEEMVRILSLSIESSALSAKCMKMWPIICLFSHLIMLNFSRSDFQQHTLRLNYTRSGSYICAM